MLSVESSETLNSQACSAIQLIIKLQYTRMKHLFLFVSFLFFGTHSLLAQQDVTFNVVLSYYIDQGLFNPETESVDVAGTFNDWGATHTPLSDPDGDSTYSVTLGGFEVGETIEFKFRFNNQWGGREEFPGAGNNREYTVTEGENIITVWYNDEYPPTGPPIASFSVSSPKAFTGSNITFFNESTGLVESIQWYFEGGSPSTSNEDSPSVWYSSSGTFDVTLVVESSEGRDSLRIEDMITVIEQTDADLYWWNDAIFYEIFVRSFYDSDGDGIGDFQGIIQKMDYLNDGDPNTHDDLGITGIWLMPISASPSYHGYDVVDYKSINPDYGTEEDFRQFMEEAHARGIRVIVDYVMNHSSTQHPWFQASASNDAFYRDFYRWSDTKPSYNGPWGQEVWHSRNNDYYYGLFWGGMPDLNYETQAVKDSMFDAATFWLEEMDVDGFRLDAVKYIFENGSELENIDPTFEFWGDFNAHVKSVKPEAFNVGEAWAGTSTVIKYVTNNRLDYAFEFDLAGNVIGGVREANAEKIIRTAEHAYNAYPYLQFGTFLTNHDQNRVYNEFWSQTEYETTSKMKLAASVYLTLPGIPYIYYGEEIGMIGSKPDEDIRLPMKWDDTSKGGFTTGNPWRNSQQYPLSMQPNVADQMEDQNSLLRWYQKLIDIRLDEAALRRGTFTNVPTQDNEVVSYLRSWEGEQVLFVANLSSDAKNNIALSLPPGAEQENEIFASLVNTDVISQEGIVQLDGYEAQVFKLVPESSVSTEQELLPKQVELRQNYPNPFNPSTTIAFSLPQSGQVSIDIFDPNGRKIQTLVNEVRQAGEHAVSWDASTLATGMYFYQLRSSGLVLTRKMTLIK